MTLATLASFLMWCSIINYGILIFWALLYIFAHGFMEKIHGRWYRLTPEQYRVMNVSGIILYKLLIILFNIVPYIALRIVM